MECWWSIIVIRSKESSGSQNPSDLGQGRSRFHPVERLGSSDDISAPIRQARLMSHSLMILDLCRVGMVLDFVDGLFPHVGIGFDPNHPLGPLTPDRGGQSGPAAQIHHQGGMRQVNQLRQQIEQSRWRRRARPIVVASFASPNFTGFCHAVFSFYSKLRTSPLDTGRKQAVHLLVETVEPGRRKATFSTRLDRLRKIALRHPGFLENESLESRATSAAVKGPYAAPGTVFSQGGPCSCGLQE